MSAATLGGDSSRDSATRGGMFPEPAPRRRAPTRAFDSNARAAHDGRSGRAHRRPADRRGSLRWLRSIGNSKRAEEITWIVVDTKFADAPIYHRGPLGDRANELLPVWRIDDELKERGNPIAVLGPPQQVRLTMRLQELTSQGDEVCFALRMLHGAVEKHVIGHQVLPTVAMAVECCVILCDHITGLCRHGCIDHALLLAPSVPPAGHQVGGHADAFVGKVIGRYGRPGYHGDGLDWRS